MTKLIHQNSRDSYQENEAYGKGETFRNRIINLLTYTDRPMTDRQIINALRVEDVNNIRPEITRLKQQGVLIEAGKTKCPITGKTVRTVCIWKPGQRKLF